MLPRTPEYRRHDRAAADPIFPATSEFPSGAAARDLLERCLARFEEFEPAVGAFVCHDIARRALPRTLPPKRWRA
jgi:hypothetical protein